MRRTVSAVLVVLALGVLGACGVGGGDDQGELRSSAADEANTTAGGDGVGASVAALSATGGGAGGSSAPAAAQTPEFASLDLASLSQAGAARQIVRTATMRVEVEKGAFRKAFASVATIASSLGGFVGSSTSAAGDDDGGDAGTLVVRVPSDRFDDARRQLQDLGELRSEELRGEDVGAQLTDLDARLRNLRAQEEAIRALMTKAKDVPETLAVQNQLGTVREQIEQLAAQQARLTDSVALSTLTIELSEPGASTGGDEPSALVRAWRQAVDGFESVIAGTIVAVGYLLPIALLALLAYGVVRALVSVRRAPAVDKVD